MMPTNADVADLLDGELARLARTDEPRLLELIPEIHRDELRRVAMLARGEVRRRAVLWARAKVTLGLAGIRHADTTASAFAVNDAGTGGRLFLAPRR